MKHRTGIFTWTGTGIYRESDAIKIYQSAKVAEKACDKLNEAENFARNLVTRTIYCDSLRRA